MFSLRSIFSLAFVALSFACTSRAHAEVLAVKPGDNLALIASKAKPGDLIELAAGVYNATTLAEIRGEAGKPITLRGPKGEFFAEFDAKDGPYALRLNQCTFVTVENLILWDARDAALDVQTLGPKSEQIMLRNIGIGFRNTSRDSIGIRVSGVRGLTIDKCRVNGVGGSGVCLDEVEQAIVSALDCHPRTKMPQQNGIVVGGPSKDVIITRCVFRYGIKTIFSLGVRYEVSEILDDIPIVERCTVTEIRADACSRFLELGSVIGLSVEHCSVLDVQGELFSLISPPKGRPGVEGKIDHLLFTWTPGFLRVFATVEGGADATKLSMGSNIYWSAELPQAMKVLGTIPGTHVSPQITNVDPKIDERGVATAAAAIGYGITDPGPSKPG
ncbi:MAG: hypothetical protein EXS10_02600 [Phycisphaerales bacterium]|nr:hypothetical protein [Phycisphaerales bacterium]